MGESAVRNFFLSLYDTEFSVFLTKGAEHVVFVNPEVLVQGVGVCDFAIEYGENLAESHSPVLGCDVQDGVVDAVEVPLSIVEGKGPIANGFIRAMIESSFVDMVAAYVFVIEVFEALGGERGAATIENVIAAGHVATVCHLQIPEIRVIYDDVVQRVDAHIIVYCFISAKMC